jgi:hypothetical protein
MTEEAGGSSNVSFSGHGATFKAKFTAKNTQ